MIYKLAPLNLDLFSPKSLNLKVCAVHALLMGVSFTKRKQIYNLVIDIVYNMCMGIVCVRVRGVVRVI